MKFSEVFKLARLHTAGLREARRKRVFTEDITADYLRGLGAKAVVLDHDGVLGPNRSIAPDGTGLKLIERMVEGFGAGAVFILSNTRSRKAQREKYYADPKLKVKYIVADKNPSTDGLEKAGEACGISVDKIAVLDDGILTGILMAASAGGIAVYTMRKHLDESLHAKAIRLFTTKPQLALVRVLGLFG